MKATSLKTAALLAGSIALLAGNATAQATSGVVGYETLDMEPGFNFVGVRLHKTPLASGTLETVTSTTAEDDDVDLGALITSGTYILEIEDGSGIIQEVTSATGSVLDVMDLSGVANGAAYTLRAADTIESIFGSSFVAFSGVLDSGLAMGSGGAAGADQIWLWNGASFDKYYADEYSENQGFGSFNWTNVDTPAAAVDAAALNLIYADGFVVSSNAGNDVIVTGDLKSGATELGLTGPGFNFVGSVAPVGANLETAFGSSFVAFSGVLDSGLAMGSAGAAGADQIWIWNGASFDKYYADEYSENQGFASFNWTNVATPAAAVTATAVPLGAGYVISAAGSKDIVQGVPAFYAGL